MTKEELKKENERLKEALKQAEYHTWQARVYLNQPRYKRANSRVTVIKIDGFFATIKEDLDKIADLMIVK